MSAEKLGEIWVSLNSTLGEFKKIGGEIVETGNGVIDLEIIFGNTERVFRIMFDKDDKARGF